MPGAVSPSGTTAPPGSPHPGASGMGDAGGRCPYPQVTRALMELAGVRQENHSPGRGAGGAGTGNHRETRSNSSQDCRAGVLGDPRQGCWGASGQGCSGSWGQGCSGSRGKDAQDHGAGMVRTTGHGCLVAAREPSPPLLVSMAGADQRAYKSCCWHCWFSCDKMWLWHMVPSRARSLSPAPPRTNQGI